MEPTFTNGHIYTQLDTGLANGTSGAAWGILTPNLSGTTLTASVAHQGVVAVKNAGLPYPFTAVASNGTGFLLFALSGPHNFPSPAYIRYGASGPTGPVILATNGAAPEDGFTCYAAFVGPNFGGCRWGDYSAGAVRQRPRVHGHRDDPRGLPGQPGNFGTFIWSAPGPLTDHRAVPDVAPPWHRGGATPRDPPPSDTAAGLRRGCGQFELDAVRILERQHVDAEPAERGDSPCGTPFSSNSRAACSKSSRLATPKLR